MTSNTHVTLTFKRASFPLLHFLTFFLCSHNLRIRSIVSPTYTMKFSNAAILTFAAVTANNYANAFVAPANKVASPTFVASRPQQLEPLAMKGAFESLFAPPKQPATMATEDQIRNLFSLWNSALATGDSRIVAKRYSKDPILLATVSDKPHTDFNSIKDYFDNFLMLKPRCNSGGQDQSWKRLGPGCGRLRVHNGSRRQKGQGSIQFCLCL
jgi:hypothetical protein